MKALCAALSFLFWVGAAPAETIRIATYNTELSQKGPGRLLHALNRASDPQVEAVIEVLTEADADILVLQGIDWDFENRALLALAQRLNDRQTPYPHLFSARPNTGLYSGLDLNGDGRVGTAADAQGFGAFTGAHGMAVLSRFPIQPSLMVDLSAVIWADLAWAQLPQHLDGRPFPSPAAQAAQRLSSTNHWILPIELPHNGHLNLMVFHASPPVFDGAEDRNGRRNHDEITLWHQVLAAPGSLPVDGPVVIAGDANLDPNRGDGRTDAIRRLLSHPRLQDPQPQSPSQGAATVDWQQTGPMRVDYILPDRALLVLSSGVLWPSDPAHVAHTASRHRLVWVDIEWP